MSDDLKRAKRAYASDPTTENYVEVQRWQLRTRLETPWPCEGTHGNGDVLPGHDLVDVPEGDALYAEQNLPARSRDGSFIRLRCCTRCGGVRRIKMVPRPDPNNALFRSVEEKLLGGLKEIS